MKRVTKATTSRRSRPFMVMVIAGLLWGCEPYSNLVTLAPGTSPDAIAFRISGTEGPDSQASGVFGLSVVRCDTEDSRWTISADGTRQMPATVVFGSPVPGFIVNTPPQRLAPGCYEVLASGAKPLRIIVGPDGRVSPAS